jgi:predicted nucleic acid-binding protein
LPSETADTQHPDAVRAVVDLHRRGEDLHVTPQVLIEFRSLATRPRALNGLGLSTEDTQRQSAAFEAMFPLLNETPDVYPAWKALVEGLGIIGKQVHDARLVAICHVHAVTHVWTFNDSHFVRMAGFEPGITAVDAGTV